MALNRLHLLHGFLGTPSDWSVVREFLGRMTGWEVIEHSLLEDLKHLADSVSFDEWVELKQQQEIFAAEKNVFVGYSLGGRLIMHLPFDKVDGALFLASHPGLEENRQDREKADLQWVEKAGELGQQRWLQSWNSQEVFQNDRIRPQREFSEQEFKLYLNALRGWSLSKQEPMDTKLQQHRDKILWAFGSEDSRFSKLSYRMRKVLTSDHVLEISDSGHGLLFDQPRGVAQAILMGIQDVE